MPTTPIYALRYPAATDPADVPLDLQELALDAEAKLAPARVTSLPGSPFDGQEVFYAADAANGVLWHLRYRAAASGSYKWEYVGGPPLLAEVVTGEARTSNSFGDMTTVGPSITLPLAGDYDITVRAEAQESTSGGHCAMSYAIGATAASVNDEGRIVTQSGFFGTVMRTRRKTVTAAATAIVAKYLASSSNGLFRSRFISAIPVRVG